MYLLYYSTFHVCKPDVFSFLVVAPLNKHFRWGAGDPNVNSGYLAAHAVPWRECTGMINISVNVSMNDACVRSLNQYSVNDRKPTKKNWLSEILLGSVHYLIVQLNYLSVTGKSGGNGHLDTAWWLTSLLLSGTAHARTNTHARAHNHKCTRMYLITCK